MQSRLRRTGSPGLPSLRPVRPCLRRVERSAPFATRLRSRLKLRLAGPLPTVLQAGEGRVGEQGSSEAPSSDSSGTVCSRASVGACAQRLVNVSATALFLQTAKRRREDERLDPVSMKLIHHLPVTCGLDPRVPPPSDKASYEE